MFTDLGKQKGLVFFGVLAFLVVVIIILVVCLDFNGGPSTGAELLASVPFIVGKCEWSKILKNGSDRINGLPSEPWDLQGLTASSVNAQLYSVGASDCSQSQYKDAVAQTLAQIDVMIRAFENYESYFKPAASTSDIYSARLLSKIAGFLAVDGGYALDSRLSTLRDYYRLGVRCVALGGLCSTPWSKSSLDNAGVASTLDNFGQSVVEEMNRLGILIDLTGSNSATQIQTIQLSRAPVIFTASSSSNLTSHPMNVDDAVLQALGAKGGLVMISFQSEQCCSDPTNCTVERIVEHINHTANIAGKTSVGIGGNVGMSVQYPQGMSTSSGFVVVFDHLLKSGAWTVTELQNLAGNNFIRMMESVEQVAKTMKEDGFLPVETEISMDSIPIGDQACYSQDTQQLMAVQNLPLTNSLLSFRSKTNSFQAVMTASTVNPSVATASTVNPSASTASTGNPPVSTTSTGNPPVSTASTVNPSVSTASTSNPSVSTASTGNPPVSTASTGNPSVSTASTVNPSVSTASTGNPSVSTASTGNPPVSTASTGNPSISTASTGNPSVSTASTGNPSVSTGSTVNPSVSTASTVNPSVSTASTRNPSVSTASTGNPSVSTASTGNPSVSTVPTGNPSVSTASTVNPSVSTASTVNPSVSTASTENPSYPSASTGNPSVSTASTSNPSVSTASTGNPSGPTASTGNPSVSTASTGNPSVSTASTGNPSVSTSSTGNPSGPTASPGDSSGSTASPASPTTPTGSAGSLPTMTPSSGSSTNHGYSSINKYYGRIAFILPILVSSRRSIRYLALMKY